MDVVIAEQSVVLTANNLNPSILKPVWLAKHGLLDDAEVRRLIVAESTLQLVTDDFELIAVPVRVQLRSHAPERFGVHAARVIGGLVSALPETPFTGIGLNCESRAFTQDREKLAAWLGANFAGPLLQNMPSGPHTVWGGYFATGWQSLRMRVDVKPLEIVPGDKSADEDDTVLVGDGGDGVGIKFNFHRDLSGDKVVADILAVLAMWEPAMTYSRKLTEQILGSLAR